MINPLPLLGALLLYGTGAVAQNYEQVAPDVPEPTSTAAKFPEPAPAAEAKDDTQLLPALGGLVFVDSSDEVVTAGVSETGVVIRAGSMDSPAFREQMSHYIGQPVTMARLQEITRQTVLFLRERNRPLVDVLIPEQDISSGTVQLLVLEGRLGELRVEGNDWFPSEAYTAAIRARPGEVIGGSEILEDVGWLNQNPFRQVDLVFSRGDRIGETDIILRARDRKPFRAYVGADDGGNALTGDWRLRAGVNAGNVFGRGHQVNYQMTVSPDFDQMVAHSGSYVMPLPWRHSLTIYGSYAVSHPDLPDDAFELEGKASQLSGRYRLPVGEFFDLRHELAVGMDLKRSNNDLAFGGTQVLQQDTGIAQFVVQYGASTTRRGGPSDAFDLTLVMSPGGITDDNDDAAFEAQRFDATADYWYTRIGLQRSVVLDQGITWNTRGLLQWSSANLLASEQLGFGGRDSVRGFEEREVNGDSGLLVRTEWVFPQLNRARLDGLPGMLDALVFVDAGVARLHNPAPSEETKRELLSAGFGFDYRLGTGLHASLTYGHQLNSSGRPAVDQNGRFHFSLTWAQ